MKLAVRLALCLACAAAATAASPRDRHSDPREALRVAFGALSLAPAEKRTMWRWTLAELYAGAGYAYEAEGVLAVIAADDPARAAEPDFVLLRSEMLIELGRAEAALAAVRSPAFDDAPRACAVRTRALERLGRSGDVLMQPHCEDSVAAMARLRAAARLGAVEEANRIAALLASVATPAVRSELAYWQGRIAAREGDAHLARRRFAEAETGAHPAAALLALAARVDLDLDTGLIDETEALARLQAARHEWRGGAAEAALLTRIAQLADRSGDHLAALGALNDLAEHQRSPVADAARTAARRRFEELMADTDAMPPADAFALMWEGRRLLPAGPEGDRIVRRMAARLARDGAYRQAANLLQHQLTDRQRGNARGETALRLAHLLILAGEPARALTTILAAQKESLTPATRSALVRAEAQALAATGRPEDAMALIAGDGHEDAARLREELAFQMHDWRRVLALFEASPPSSIDTQARRRVLRAAIAAALTADRLRARVLQRKYGTLFEGNAAEDIFERLILATETGDLAELRLAVAAAARQASSAARSS